MKLFSSLLMTRQNKLECLHLAKTLQSSLTLAGSTRSLHKKEVSERTSNWVGSGLALKLKTQLERVTKGKPSSFLALVVNDEEKKFQNIRHLVVIIDTTTSIKHFVDNRKFIRKKYSRNESKMKKLESKYCSNNKNNVIRKCHRRKLQ